jgi:hypothetical protein
MESRYKQLRRTFVGFATSVLVFTVFTSPASAYPPGQTLALSVSNTQVSRGQSITLRVTNARPGVLTLKFGTITKRTVVSSTYKTPSVLVAPTTAGIYVTRATAKDAETAWTRVYVPSATAPAAVRTGSVASLIVRYAKPGSVVTVSVDGDTFVGVVGNASTVVVPFSVENKGNLPMTVTIGTVTISGLRTTGR